MSLFRNCKFYYPHQTQINKTLISEALLSLLKPNFLFSFLARSTHPGAVKTSFVIVKVYTDEELIKQCLEDTFVFT